MGCFKQHLTEVNSAKGRKWMEEEREAHTQKYKNKKYYLWETKHNATNCILQIPYVLYSFVWYFAGTATFAYCEEKGKRTYSAKIWLKTLRFSDKGSLSKEELSLVQRLVEKHQAELLKLFDKAKRGQKFEPLKLTLK